MQNVHGKEIDLLRTTVKIPGKRPPRAVATVAPTASPKTNGLTKDRSGLQLGIGNAGMTPPSLHPRPDRCRNRMTEVTKNKKKDVNTSGKIQIPPTAYLLKSKRNRISRMFLPVK